MKKFGMGQVFIALFLILILSMFMFLFGRSDDTSAPSASSSFPSGIGAFAELLRRQGYRVVVDRHERPFLEPQDMAVCVSIGEEGTKSEPTDPPKRTLKQLEAHLKKGGRVLEFEYPLDFQEASSKAVPVLVADQVNAGEPRSVTVYNFKGKELELPTEVPEYDAWTTPSGTFVCVASLEQGVAVRVSSAIGVTNRFLAKEDNAAFYSGLVDRLARPGGRIVFVEATINEFDAQGVLSNFGNWAVATQWQVVLLLLVMAYTVSRRFGYSQDDRPDQRGARQLVDAVAEVLRTAKKHEFSAEILAASALDTVRASLRLPPSATEDEILKASSAEFSDAYFQLKHAKNDKLSKVQTIVAVRAMQDAVFQHKKEL